jgi:hypothetical protein
MNVHPEMPLASLPHPVYLVHKGASDWQDLMNLKPAEQPPPAECVIDRFSSASDSWLINTFIELRRRSLDVRLTDSFVKNAICLTSYDELRIADIPFNCYVVACQHDRARPEICEQRIVQNQLNVRIAQDHWMPLWPQPGLEPRNPGRGTMLQNIVFLGRRINLAKPFLDAEFSEGLSKLGVKFVIRGREPEQSYRAWSDYSDVDIVLAVRNNTAYDLSIKPPSKLVNAWIAGCPAILGPEPAFQQLRQSELDFIEVRSTAEAIAAIEYLKNNPSVFLSMVENGRKRAQAFLPQQLAQRWWDLLSGPIATGYEAWQRQSPLRKMAGRPVEFIWRAARHRYERYYFRRWIHQGPRLFDPIS